MTDSKADDLISLSQQLYLYAFGFPARNCFKARDSVEEVARFFEDKINNKIKYKYMLLTMHDSNITSILRFLNYTPIERPKYNANVRFDLLKSRSDDKFYVMVKFDQKTIKICQQNDICSLDEFKQLIAENINKQCSDFNVDQDYLKKVGIISEKAENQSNCSN
jgi:hypothetical protein